MAQLKRTLLIGLGGTGVTTILNAKKMYYETYGEIPPMIGFVGIDTDSPSLRKASVTANDGKEISLDMSEQLCISAPTAFQMYQHDPSAYKWVPQNNVSGLRLLSTTGAGQIRSNGRFALTVNEVAVRNFITNKFTQINNARNIDNAKYDSDEPAPEVHMVFSLGGGTGSGTFLNAAYLVKSLMPEVKVSGYAVLGDIFRIMDASAKSAFVKLNSYGAIMDMDYLTSLVAENRSTEIKWLRNSMTIGDRPFNACYFIDYVSRDNNMFNDVDDLCKMIALAIVTSSGQLGTKLASISDNVNQRIEEGSMDVLNKKAWVASFGCAEIIFDGNRLAKIYARKAMVQLINKMLNGGCDDPTVIANNWFDANKIRENLSKDDVIDYFMSAQPRHSYTEVGNPENPEPECLHYVANRAMETTETLNEKLSELQTRIDESLRRLMNEHADRECGIFLCGGILTSILHQVELCDAEMKQETHDLNERIPALESALKTNCNELQRCMGTFFKNGRKSYEEEVVSATINLAVAKREIMRRTMARQFYSWLKERIAQSITRVDVISENLKKVRTECSNEVVNLQRTSLGESFFQFDLSDDYATKVECPVDDIVFNDFAHSMKGEGGVASLATLTSAQTSEALWRYVTTLPQAQKYAKMNVDDAFEQMSEGELHSLLAKAIKKSLPLLTYTYRGRDAEHQADPVESYYIGVADKTRSRLNKEMLQSIIPNAIGIEFAEVGLTNRVIIYRQFGVVPAFTVKALDSYEYEYERKEESAPGTSHWDDQIYKQMRKERFSLTPRKARKNAIEPAWINAIVYGLIKYNEATGQYQIKSRGMGGSPLRGWMVDMGSSRQEAYNYYEDNADVLDQEISNAINEMDVPGPNNPVRVLTAKAIEACKNNTYLQEVSQCPYSIDVIDHYEADKELIEKEITYILDILAQ